MDEAHDTQLCHILQIQERPCGCPAPGGQPFLLQLLGIDLAASKLKCTGRADLSFHVRCLPRARNDESSVARRSKSMELGELIEGLSRPQAYPFPAQQIEVRHTHISVVFLAGPYAYKVKKPVNLGFLDFSTLEKRRYFCEQEVLLNRRLSPSVYLGVVAIARTSNGIQVEAP